MLFILLLIAGKRAVHFIINTLLFKGSVLLSSMENQLRILQSKIDQLEKENQFKTEWLSKISHDFRETFGSIIWLTQAIEEETLAHEDFFKLLPRVKTDAEKNLKLIADTSEWLKIKNESLIIQHSRLEAIELFEELKTTFQQELKDKNIQLSFKGDKSLVIFSDHFLISLLFKKLLDNAIKYSHLNGSIIFSVKKDDDKTIIDLSDKGIGISKKNLESCLTFGNAIFPGTKGELGNGIGLKIAQDIVYLLQGELKIQSEENIGTTICVIIS